MNWEQMQDTFYNCLDFCEMYDRLPYFYLTGGDPILHLLSRGSSVCTANT